MNYNKKKFKNKNLEELLSSLRDRDIIYVPNPGNAGDSMIAAATYQLFDRLGVNYRVVAHKDCTKEIVDRKVVVYGGGGNFTSHSKGNACRNVISRVHMSAEQVVLLPHTISGNEDLLKNLGSNVHIFCREIASYEHVKRQARLANIYIAHDLALQLDIAEYLEPNNLGISSLRNPFNELVKYPFHCIKDKYLTASCNHYDHGTLSCYRTDKEQSTIERPKNNQDISRLFKGVSLSPENAHAVTRRLIRFLNQFSTVKTNRLHIGIGAAILGKKVFFYPNNYFKNSAVYEFSIRQQFSNVVWCG